MHNTRPGNKLRTPKYNTNIVKITVWSKGATVWNKNKYWSSGKNVKSTMTLIFKQKVKDLLFENTLTQSSQIWLMDLIFKIDYSCMLKTQLYKYYSVILYVQLA